MLEEGRTGDQRESKGATMAWVKNEVIRVGLAETLSTFVMMVRSLCLQQLLHILSALSVHTMTFDATHL